MVTWGYPYFRTTSDLASCIVDNAKLLLRLGLPSGHVEHVEQRSGKASTSIPAIPYTHGWSSFSLIEIWGFWGQFGVNVQFSRPHLAQRGFARSLIQVTQTDSCNAPKNDPSKHCKSKDLRPLATDPDMAMATFFSPFTGKIHGRSMNLPSQGLEWRIFCQMTSHLMKATDQNDGFNGTKAHQGFEAPDLLVIWPIQTSWQPSDPPSGQKRAISQWDSPWYLPTRCDIMEMLAMFIGTWYMVHHVSPSFFQGHPIFVQQLQVNTNFIPLDGISRNDFLQRRHMGRRSCTPPAQSRGDHIPSSSLPLLSPTSDASLGKKNLLCVGEVPQFTGYSHVNMGQKNMATTWFSTSRWA